MREIRITPFCSPLTTSPEWRPMEREMKELMRQKELLLEEEVVPPAQPILFMRRPRAAKVARRNERSGGSRS
jgi:hypothetical protein